MNNFPLWKHQKAYIDFVNKVERDMVFINEALRQFDVLLQVIGDDLTHQEWNDLMDKRKEHYKDLYGHEMDVDFQLKFFE